MAKVTKAQRIAVVNCECCGSVHILLVRGDRVFAEAIPAGIEQVEAFAADLAEAIAEMRRRGGTHVH